MADRERRRYERFRIPVRIVIRGRGVEEACLTEQLGMGGCQITLSRALAEGTTVLVELSAEPAPAPLSGSAQVAWVAAEAPWRTGLAFEPALVEAMAPFLRALVGSAPLLPPPDGAG